MQLQKAVHNPAEENPAAGQSLHDTAQWQGGRTSDTPAKKNQNKHFL